MAFGDQEGVQAIVSLYIMAAAQEISVDASSIAAVLLELDGIFTLIEKQRTTLKA